MENKPSGGRFLVALLAFALTAATGIVLLLTTLVVWLSALTGSLVTATLIVSGLCFLLAAAIYALALRAPIDRIQDQVETIYDVAHAAKTGYEWLSGKLQLFLAVREELRKERYGKIRMPAGIRIFHASRSRKDGPHQLRNSTNTFV